MTKSHNDEALVTIASFPTDFEASLAKGMLEQVGIRAFVPGEAFGMLSRGRGGMPTGILQVFESDRERAVAELRRKELKIGKPSGD